MPRPKSFDEDTVLDQAVQLFWERGYEATSLADLEAHLGLGRQSLYNTFGDKQTLFLKALDAVPRSMSARAALAPLDAPGRGPRRPFARSSSRAVESLTAPGARRGCLVTNTIPERGSQDADALLRLQPARDALERAFRRALAQAKERGRGAAQRSTSRPPRRCWWSRTTGSTSWPRPGRPPRSCTPPWRRCWRGWRRFSCPFFD